MLPNPTPPQQTFRKSALIALTHLIEIDEPHASLKTTLCSAIEKMASDEEVKTYLAKCQADVKPEQQGELTRWLRLIDDTHRYFLQSRRYDALLSKMSTSNRNYLFRPIKTELHAKNDVTDVISLPNGKFITGDSSGFIQIWHIDLTGNFVLQQTLHEHSKQITCLTALLPNSNFVTGDKKGMIIIWREDAKGQYHKQQSFYEPTIFFERTPVTSLAALPDGAFVVNENNIISSDQQGRYHDGQSLPETQTSALFNRQAFAVTLPNHTILRVDGNLDFFEPDANGKYQLSYTLSEGQYPLIPHPRRRHYVGISNNEFLVASSKGDFYDLVRIYDIVRRKNKNSRIDRQSIIEESSVGVFKLNVSHLLTCFDISQQYDIVCGLHNGQINIWRRDATGNFVCVHTWTAHEGSSVNGIRLSPQGHIISYSGQNIAVWSFPTLSARIESIDRGLYFTSLIKTLELDIFPLEPWQPGFWDSLKVEVKLTDGSIREVVLTKTMYEILEHIKNATKEIKAINAEDHQKEILYQKALFDIKIVLVKNDVGQSNSHKDIKLFYQTWLDKLTILFDSDPALLPQIKLPKQELSSGSRNRFFVSTSNITRVDTEATASLYDSSLGL